MEQPHRSRLGPVAVAIAVFGLCQVWLTNTSTPSTAARPAEPSVVVVDTHVVRGHVETRSPSQASVHASETAVASDTAAPSIVFPATPKMPTASALPVAVTETAAPLDESSQRILRHTTTTASATVPWPTPAPAVRSAPPVSEARRTRSALLCVHPIDVGCVMRQMSLSPYPCSESSVTHLYLLRSFGTLPQPRTMASALRQVSMRGMCGYALYVAESAQCSRADALWRADVNDLAAAAAPKWAARAQQFVEEHGPDATMHVQDVGHCAIDELRPARFPFLYFGWQIHRVCVPTASAVAALAEGLRGRLKVATERVVTLDVSGVAWYSSHDNGTVVRHACVASEYCKHEPATHCAQRAQHIKAIRKSAEARDVFGDAVSFLDRRDDANFRMTGLVAAATPAQLDEAPKSCERVQRGIAAAALAATVKRRAPLVSVAALMSGAIRTMRVVVPRIAETLQGLGPVHWFAALLTEANGDAAHDGDIRLGLNAILEQESLAALIVSRREHYPADADVFRDYPHAHELRSNPAYIALTLGQYLRFHVPLVLRRMYELRCGFGFDMSLRMRPDTYLNLALPQPWLPMVPSNVLWVDRDRDAEGGLNDQFWVAESHIIDRVTTIYFFARELSASRYQLHAESMTRAFVEALCVGGAMVVSRPKHRIAEIYREFGQQIGWRSDQRHLTAQYCNATHCNWPDP